MTDEFKEKYFHRSFMSNLRLDEYFATLDQVSTYLEGLETQDAHVRKTVNNLAGHLVVLDKIVERRKFHDESTEIQDMATERHKKLRFIVDTAKLMKDSDNEDKREAAKVVSSFIRKESRAFSRKRIKIQNGLLRRFRDAVNGGDPWLEESLEELDLTTSYEDYAKLTNRIVSAMHTRLHDINRLAEMARKARARSYKDFVTMLNALEQKVFVESDEQDMFHKLCNDVRTILVSHQASYLLRVGESDGSADADSDDETSPKEEES